MNIPNLESFLSGYLAALSHQHSQTSKLEPQDLARLGKALITCKPLMTGAYFQAVCSRLKLTEADIEQWVTVPELDMLSAHEADAPYREPYLDNSMAALNETKDCHGVWHLYSVVPSSTPGYFGVRYQRGTPASHAPIPGFRTEDFVVNTGPFPYYSIPNVLHFYGMDQPTEVPWDLREPWAVDDYEYLI